MVKPARKPAPAPPPPPTVLDSSKPVVDWEARKTVLASHELLKLELGQTTLTTKFEIASFDGKEPKMFMRTWKASPKFNGPTGEGGSWTYEQLQELVTALEAVVELWDALPQKWNHR